MSLILVHLSDIHFGQERGKLVYVHEDARERLLDDVRAFAQTILPKRISGVVVTGDIAFAGTETEYRAAGEWLDRLTEIIGCGRAEVQIVPGNHDIDWSKISNGAAFLLKEIKEGGEDKLNEFLRNDDDRELLYRRFHAYGDFADAYNCALDRTGGGASDRLVELAPERRLRFVGLNTALACSKEDTEGKLLLGERQRVLPRRTGEELIVLAHHPLKWMADAAEATDYVRARARVLVTGHEHAPRAKVENIFDGADLLTIEAGATTPPWSDDEFTYTYNFLEFGWDETQDGLAVTIHPRSWCETKKEFEEDTERIDVEAKSVVLASPRFREAPKVAPADAAALAENLEPPVIQQETSNGNNGSEAMSVEYRDIILRFFRDLAPGQRLRLLVELKAVPNDWSEPLSHGYERILLDRAIKNGAEAVRAKIEQLTFENENGEANG